MYESIMTAADQPPAGIHLELPDEAATRAFAGRLAGLLRTQDFVGLGGVLGAGKTTCARHMIAALAGREIEVPSPSFTLVQSYDFDRFTLWHFDLYRIESPEEVFELGFDDALADGVTLVEWPERLGPLRPADRLDVTFSQGPSRDARVADIEAHGDWRERLAGLRDD